MIKKTLPLLMAISILASCNGPVKNKIVYPETKKGEVADTFFGTVVPDPYRWLEDDMSEETGTWVKEQNKVTFGYLETIPYREEIKNRLTKIWNYEKYTIPYNRGRIFILFQK